MARISIEGPLKHLEIVFRRLDEYGVVIILLMCQDNQTEVNFLDDLLIWRSLCPPNQAMLRTIKAFCGLWKGSPAAILKSQPKITKSISRTNDNLDLTGVVPGQQSCYRTENFSVSNSI